MCKTLIEAAKAIIHQRDYYAEHVEYDKTTYFPDVDGDTMTQQCFDDWAADILETALATDASPE